VSGCRCLAVAFVAAAFRRAPLLLKLVSQLQSQFAVAFVAAAFRRAPFVSSSGGYTPSTIRKSLFIFPSRMFSAARYASTASPSAECECDQEAEDRHSNLRRAEG
jgi:hypothetical protein